MKMKLHLNTLAVPHKQLYMNSQIVSNLSEKVL